MTLEELLLKNKLTKQRKEREARQAAAAAAEETPKKAEESKKGQRKGKKPSQREFLVVDPEVNPEQTSETAESPADEDTIIENPEIIE